MQSPNKGNCLYSFVCCCCRCGAVAFVVGGAAAEAEAEAAEAEAVGETIADFLSFCVNQTDTLFCVVPWTARSPLPLTTETVFVRLCSS